jgi:predicted O-methyltransferase YrrM
VSKEKSGEKIINTVRAYQQACVIAAAAELDIFSTLSNHPLTAKSVSFKLSSDPRATIVILDALAALGLLHKKGNKFIVPNDLKDVLTEKSPNNILPAIRHHANCLRHWAQLASVVKTGKPAKRFPSIRGKAADIEAFINAMNNFSATIANQIVQKLKLPTFKHLLDIGGASGTWIIAFLRSVPKARATLFDLPDVIPLARKRISEAGLTDRVTFVAGNYYYDDLPKGADFVWLSAVAHQNSRRQNRKIFSKIYKALTTNGILIIRDVVIEPSRTKPTTGALFAVNMLVSNHSGGTYTFDEFKDDLSSKGFSHIKLLHLPLGMAKPKDNFMNSLIRAEKTR